MGFFSQECTACGHPALSLHAVSSVNRWMNDVVVIRPDGFRARGSYDGYGRVETDEGTWDNAVGLEANTVWHGACWEVAGEPTDYRGESPNADDQGYFFDDADHAMPDPRLVSR